MIYACFILGVIIGLLIAILVAVLVFRYQKPLERMSKMTINTFREKGSVLEVEDETISDWIKELPDGH